MQVSKLGAVSAITISSPDLEKSLSFYQKLGFYKTASDNFPFPWIQISDGSLLIMLRHDTKSFISLTYYCKTLDTLVRELEASGIVFFIKPDPADMIRRFVFKSPDGLSIALVSFVDAFKQPTGYSAMNFPPNDFFEPSKYPNDACGIFGEFAHPVKDLDSSISFWQQLGFTGKEKYSNPYPWIIMTDGLAIVGLHQTETFDYPVITYFAADQAAKIKNLKAAGISDFVSKGGGSITLTTPESQHINLFNIGM